MLNFRKCNKKPVLFFTITWVTQNVKRIVSAMFIINNLNKSEQFNIILLSYSLLAAVHLILYKLKAIVLLNVTIRKKLFVDSHTFQRGTLRDSAGCDKCVCGHRVYFNWLGKSNWRVK